MYSLQKQKQGTAHAQALRGMQPLVPMSSARMLTILNATAKKLNRVLSYLTYVKGQNWHLWLLRRGDTADTGTQEVFSLDPSRRQHGNRTDYTTEQTLHGTGSSFPLNSLTELSSLPFTGLPTRSKRGICLKKHASLLFIRVFFLKGFNLCWAFSISHSAPSVPVGKGLTKRPWEKTK